MKPIAEGKTKQLFPYTVIMEAKDRVTWGNEHEADMPGKGDWSTETTVNVFRLFQEHGEEVAFIQRDGSNSFIAPYCRMIPLEVVGRSVIDPKSSFLKRNPNYTNIGAPLEIPEIEFFLKSSGKVFNGISLPDDDPLIIDDSQGGVGKDGFWVCHPATGKDEVFIPKEAFDYAHDLTELFQELRIRMGDLTMILRDAWARPGWTLGDWKGEFGFDPDGNLLLADVVDNDSWRLRDPQGNEQSKQVVRDRFAALFRPGMSEAEIEAIRQQAVRDSAPCFARVAEMSKLLPGAPMTL